MNKLEFQTGGHPLHLDDIQFLQTAVLEAIQGLASIYGSDFRVTGALLDNSGPNASWTSGYVVIGGEVYEVEAGNKTGVFTTPVFTPIETISDPSPVLYADGQLKNVHKFRKATVEEDTGQSIKAAVTGIAVAYDSASIAISNWPQVGSSSLVSRRRGKHVDLAGVVKNNTGLSSSVDTKIAELADGYMPLTEQLFVVATDEVSLGLKSRLIRVKTNGDIEIVGGIIGDGKITLSGVGFDVD